MNFEHFFGGDSATGSSSSNNTNETNQNQNQNQNQSRNGNLAANALVEGSGSQVDDGIEDASVTEERFMKLLMYRVKIGWSD